MSRSFEKFISFFINVFTLTCADIGRAVQHEMTKTERPKYFYYASYKDFKEALNKRQWMVIPGYISLESVDGSRESYIHANIYRFGDTGYLMTTLGQIRAKRLIKKTVSELQTPPFAIKNASNAIN